MTDKHAPKPNIPEKFLKPYNPAETEARIYKLWEESGFFSPNQQPTTNNQQPTKRYTLPARAEHAGGKARSFCLIMPPPNANGHLHAGHALFITLEDIMTRYKRMRGYKTLWLPGADHAGFETQIVYEKKLEKEGRSRFKMEPKELFGEIMAFTLENKKFMESEVRSLGASCDWTRERFTLDSDIIKKVQQTFKKMHDDGLIYRGPRIVNWCSKHATSLSDVETENREVKDKFYYFQYGPFIIGTSRPETKFGDKYVVMHPEDKRYNKYKDGEKIELEWINRKITATVIKDEAVDMEFGTGVMTITPWHDAADFEIAKRHDLDREQVIDWRGKLLPIAGEFAGQKITEARPKIVEKLKAKGLLVKVEENYVHNVPLCYKCETPIEPQIMPQWFVKMAPLAKLATDAVEAEKIKFVPDNYRKIFLYWMRNALDWNISRQIVWGIPIPAKICGNCGEGMPDLENEVTKCPKCGGAVHADTDTFDTWFSSGQWPLLTLNFKDSEDFKTFYPTDVMETGSDLIFKWVPRMVIFGLYLAGEVPFRTVYLHGLVNDAKGQKMSKSKGNIINPLELTAKYGTDALRIALIVGNTPGTDLALSENRIKGYKYFTNKLWNIARFVLENTPEDISGKNPQLSETDEVLIKNFEALSREVTEDMENFRFYLAAEKIYHYVWHEFADKMIEEKKSVLNSDNASAKKSAEQLLRHILKNSLILLHPFMPFVTEEIWAHFGKKNLLMVEEWPVK